MTKDNFYYINESPNGTLQKNNMEKEKPIFETNNISEALLVKVRLEAENIVVLMKGESVGGAYAITTDGWGKIRLYVNDEQKELAEEVIRESQQEKL